MIDGQAGGRIAVGHRPGRGNGLCRRIEAHNLILALDIGEYCAPCRLRPGTQACRRECDGGHHFALSGINHGCIITAAIEGPHRFGYGFKHNPIRIRARGNRSHAGQRGAVKDHHHIRAPVADISKLARIVERHSMGAFQPRDAAHDFSGIAVQHFDPRAVGDIETVRLGIGSKVVPAALTSNLPLGQDAVRFLRERTAGGRRQQDRGAKGQLLQCGAKAMRCHRISDQLDFNLAQLP